MLRITVFCKGHIGYKVRLLEGTVSFRDENDKIVTEASETAQTVVLDVANLYCEGDVLKAEHDFGYYFVV